jgi:hypothetical protein
VLASAGEWCWLWATERATSTAAVTTPNTAAAWKPIPSWAFISTGEAGFTAATSATESKESAHLFFAS